MNGAAGLLERLGVVLGREGDRVPTHAPETVLGLDDHAPLPQTLALALQQVAIQSIYFVLPGVVAAAFGAGPLEATNFLCLSLVCMALAAVLQAVRRGPVGSGYPIPAIPSVVMFAPLMLAAQMGASLGEAAAMMALVGFATMALVPFMRRLSALMPTEVTGVVVFLIGASVLPTVMQLLALDPAAPGAALPQLGVALACFAAMVAVGVPRWRFARYAVLLGALAGIALALALGMASPQAAALLAEAPWVALPRPIPWGQVGFEPTLLGSFLLCTVAAVASLVGSLVAFQRATDGGWTRPDPGPLRRGLLAHGLAVVFSGLAGGMAPATSSASVGVSIATRTYARSIAIAGAGLLFVLAFCPKLAAVFVLVPAPVQAAMLLYVAGFMMAQGCEMLVLRSLDARRTVVAGLGLSAGLSALVAPAFFLAALPALAAPLAIGTVVAFVANLATLPLVRRDMRFEQPLRGQTGAALEDRVAAIGGAWGLRPDTVRRMHHALIELGDLLAGRGVAAMAVAAVQQEERVRLTVAFVGAPLPRPARHPRVADFDAGGDALEPVALWLALRETSRHGTRPTATAQELWMEFQD
jgi:NCS2 family nucleobase:cation symporter-2